MREKQSPPVGLPLKGKPTIIYAASFLIAILIGIVSMAGIVNHENVYPTEELAQAFLPNDFVNLLVGLPILLGSMWLAWRGKLIGLLCWPGALFFVLYNYLAYTFAMPPGWHFVIYLLLSALSIYSVAGLLAMIEGRAVQEALRGYVPEKFSGGVLAGLGALFFLRAIGVIAGALINGETITSTELAVNISDMLTTPAWIIGGILLWQRKEFGYVTGMGLLYQGSMLFIALIFFLGLQPVLFDRPFAVTDIAVVFVMGLVCFIPFILFIRGARTSRRI